MKQCFRNIKNITVIVIMMLVKLLFFFIIPVSPSSEVFLEQLENSREALQDYGIFILKVELFSAL